MISRRIFLTSLVAASFPFRLIARSLEERFSIGISDLVISGQIKPEAAQVIVQGMSALFEIPGKPKPQFEISGSSLLGKQLQNKQIHLCIMLGIEYGWLKKSFPDLKPLVTAFTTDIRLKACLLVHADSQAKDVMDLQGKTLVLPHRLQQHNYWYLHDEIVEHGAEPKGFFEQSISPSDSNEGVEYVIDKKAAAILLDGDAWKGYQQRKPARAKKLRMIDQSLPFPTAAVLYQRNNWNDKDLSLLKKVLCTAHEKPFTRQILNFWRISKFVPYTAEYEEVVKNILHEMPDPVTPASFVKK